MDVVLLLFSAKTFLVAGAPKPRNPTQLRMTFIWNTFFGLACSSL